jgi:hypothetical protein
VDLLVREPCGAEPIDLLRSGRGRVAGQSQRVVKYRPQPRLDLCPIRIRLDPLREVILAQGTERRSVMSYSIVALVGGRNGHRDRLPLEPCDL